MSFNRGLSASQQIAPIRRTLARDLMKWIRPSTPNRRLKPARGETLPGLGASLPGAQMKPCWMILPAAPAAAAVSSTVSTNGQAAPMAMRATPKAPPWSSSKASGWATNGSRAMTMLRAITLPAIASTPTAAVIDAHGGRSGLLATSP